MGDFELRTEMADKHRASLTAISDSVTAAGTAGRTRLGENDFGALFVMLAAGMNLALGQVGGTVAVHARELVEHRDEFDRTVKIQLQADANGAKVIGG